MDNVKVIKCKKCGAPSYAEQSLEGFTCPYCKDYIPWAITQGHYAPKMVFRHRPIPIVDGLLKLTHVGLPERSPGDPRLTDEMSLRTCSMDNNLLKLDSTAFKYWTGKEMLMIPCSQCGATITGYSTQSILICDYCKNKVMDTEVFSSGNYRNEVFGYDSNMYNLALPYAISFEQAKRQILNLVADYPDDFSNQDISRRIDADLHALYLPYSLEDVSLKATVRTNRGTLTFYHERINWALPSFSLFDIYLLNELHPWDFGKMAPFAPAFLENDVRVFAPQNNEARTTALKRMLWRDTPSLISSAFGLERVELLTWDYNFRRHKYAYFNLPIWFLDKRKEDGDADLQTRVAINGQTGKAAALFLQNGKKDFVRVREANSHIEMSDESTIFSPPIPIEYVKSPFLFKTLTLDEALK